MTRIQIPFSVPFIFWFRPQWIKQASESTGNVSISRMMINSGPLMFWMNPTGVKYSIYYFAERQELTWSEARAELLRLAWLYGSINDMKARHRIINISKIDLEDFLSTLQEEDRKALRFWANGGLMWSSVPMHIRNSIGRKWRTRKYNTEDSRSRGQSSK